MLERKELCAGFWWGNLRERDNLKRKWDVGVWTGFIWLRIGTGGGHNRDLTH
jgi:hypothetical protein